MELRPTEAKPSSEDWCGASPEVIVKRSIPWRNNSHICHHASRVRVLLLPAAHHRPALGEMVTFPLLLFSLGQKGVMRRHNAVLSAVVQMDFRILTVWSYHHQCCLEESHWIMEGQIFWWIKHKFFHMPRAFLMATVSQLGMFLRNGGPVGITCGDAASDAFVPPFVREKDCLSCFLDHSKYLSSLKFCSKLLLPTAAKVNVLQIGSSGSNFWQRGD